MRLRAFVDSNNNINQNNINQNFSTVIEMFNTSLKLFDVILDVNDRKVIIGNTECKLSPREFSLYLLVAKLKKKGETLYYPPKDYPDITIEEEHQQLFNEIYNKYRSKKEEKLVNERYLSHVLSYLRAELTQAFGAPVYEKIGITPVEGGLRRSIKLDKDNIIIRQ